ncbi:hypothetical protein [uncultured Zoogloea sp.]|uniref:hypothetical protein n=1 Tax=uncultured Zoogloea sp. TaxID=160237 RepID=UPI0026062A34|nr:hypothetical protein [uncultured Zoogloea sp.]
MNYFEYITAIGPFRITQVDGGWATYFENGQLDWYSTPEQALDDLVSGHGQWPSHGIDPSTLGLPDCLSEWKLLRL